MPMTKTASPPRSPRSRYAIPPSSPLHTIAPTFYESSSSERTSEAEQNEEDAVVSDIPGADYYALKPHRENVPEGSLRTAALSKQEVWLRRPSIEKQVPPGSEKRLKKASQGSGSGSSIGQATGHISRDEDEEDYGIGSSATQNAVSMYYGEIPRYIASKPGSYPPVSNNSRFESPSPSKQPLQKSSSLSRSSSNPIAFHTKRTPVRTTQTSAEESNKRNTYPSSRQYLVPSNHDDVSMSSADEDRENRSGDNSDQRLPSITANGKGKKRALGITEPVEERHFSKEDPLDPILALNNLKGSVGSWSTSKKDHKHPARSTSELSSASTKASPSTSSDPKWTASDQDQRSTRTSIDTFGSGSYNQPSKNDRNQQPSLQQLLRTVDLGAAMKLVQTLQQIPNPPGANIPPSAPVNVSSLETARAPSVRFNQTPTLSSSISTPSRLGSVEPFHKQDVTSSQSLSNFTFPKVTESGPATQFSPTTSKPVVDGTADAREEVTAGRERRKSFSVAVLGTVGKRMRVPSMSSPSSAAPPSSLEPILQSNVGNQAATAGANSSTAGPLGSKLGRIPDERAHMSEDGRSFEDQISKVHLSLSPATLRRAQNCAKYLSMRYNPVYVGLSSPQFPSGPHQIIPNLLTVSRWRTKEEEILRYKRQAMSWGHPAQLVVQAGRTANSALPYVANRNKHPKVWEVFPNEIAEYMTSRVATKITPLGSSTPQSPPTSRTRTPTMTSESEKAMLRTAPAADSPPPLDSPPATQSVPQSPTSALEKRSPLPRPTYSRASSVDGGPTRQSDSLYNSVPSSIQMPLSYNTSYTSLPLPRSPLKNSRMFMEGSADKSLTNNDALYDLPSQYKSSPQGSRESLLEGLPHKGVINDSTYATSHRHASSHRSTLSESGLRSNLNRRLDRIRGRTVTDGDSGVGDGNSKSIQRGSEYANEDGATTDLSEVEGNTHNRRNRASGDHHRLKKKDHNGMMPSSTSFFPPDSEEWNRAWSGDEDRNINARRKPGRGGRFIAAAWQGFKGSLEAYPGAYGGEYPYPTRPNGRGKPFTDADLPRGLQRRLLEFESEEEDWRKPPQDLLDISDEAHTRLNGLLRQLRVQLNHIDAYLPKVPKQLNVYLDKMMKLETATQSIAGCNASFARPRLAGSMVAELAESKQAHQHETHSIEPIVDGTSTDTSDETSTDESTSGDDSEVSAFSSPAVRQNRANAKPSSIPPHRMRRATEGSSLKPAIRPQSNENAAKHMDTESITGGADNFRSLENIIDDHKKVIQLLTAEGVNIKKHQEKIRKDIEAVVQDVNLTQRKIDTSTFPHLRMLEDRYFRLRTILTRPSSSIDALWAALSYGLAGLFWVSWLVVTIFRISRKMLTFPISILRWLLYVG